MKGLCEKYKPKNLGKILGQGVGVRKLLECFESGQAAFLHGPVGVGKTCSVYALADEKGYDVIEINASDLRNGEQINRVIGEALNHGSLFGKGKILLVDEVDGLYGMEDRGGVHAIEKIIACSRKSNYVVLTANDPWNKKLNGVRKKSVLVEYKKLGIVDLGVLMKEICEKESVDVDQFVLRKIMARCGGDARAALMDLQCLSIGKKSVILEDVGVLGEREKEKDVFDALRLIFKSCSLDDVHGAFDGLSLKYNEIFMWIDENLPLEYSGDDLVKAYEMISRADIFQKRIIRWQYWRFLVYVYFLLSCGVACAKKEAKKGFVPYKRSTRPLKIWINNMKNAKRKGIAERVGVKLHTSKKRFVKDDFPYLKLLVKRGIVPDIGLTEEEIEWIRK
tara:strand:- start:1701 stop:2879 length:1179 start_codon:yes stop_codon:yes gene_type:complete